MSQGKKSVIVIVGGNFQNKGAQSMLFVTVSEIKKRNPNADIYFATWEKPDLSNYTFSSVFYNMNAQKIALGEKSILFTEALKNPLRKLLGRKTVSLRDLSAYRKLLKKADCIIDISGFELSSEENRNGNLFYLNNIRLARKNNIPIILMPQSFGPFDYGEDCRDILSQIPELMRYPKRVFTREKAGAEALQALEITDTLYSPDLVLQNNRTDLSLIFKTIPEIRVPQIEKNSVAIIPNHHCFSGENKTPVFEIYRELIALLRKESKNVYLFRHASEDLAICRELKAMFAEDENVVLLTEDFSGLEYSELIKQFEFAVCSRYHGVVHAYRNGIPCIVVGWAAKYRELAEITAQESYCYLMDSLLQNTEKLTESVSYLSHNYAKESETIKERIQEIQKTSVFDSLGEFIGSK